MDKEEETAGADSENKDRFAALEKDGWVKPPDGCYLVRLPYLRCKECGELLVAFISTETKVGESFEMPHFCPRFPESHKTFEFQWNDGTWEEITVKGSTSKALLLGEIERGQG